MGGGVRGCPGGDLRGTGPDPVGRADRPPPASPAACLSRFNALSLIYLLFLLLLPWFPGPSPHGTPGKGSRGGSRPTGSRSSLCTDPLGLGPGCCVLHGSPGRPGYRKGGPKLDFCIVDPRPSAGSFLSLHAPGMLKVMGTSGPIPLVPGASLPPPTPRTPVPLAPPASPLCPAPPRSEAPSICMSSVGFSLSPAGGPSFAGRVALGDLPQAVLPSPGQEGPLGAGGEPGSPRGAGRQHHERQLLAEMESQPGRAQVGRDS